VIRRVDALKLTKAKKEPVRKPDGISMTAVKSGRMRAIGYDQANGVMQIEFAPGLEFQYPNVTPKQWQAFQEAESKGKFFNEHFLGSPKHPARKLEPKE
jgi:hypothetical protein